MPLETDEFWEQRVRALTASSERIGPGRLLRLLQDESKQTHRLGVPSLRTIGRIQQKFRLLDARAQMDYRVLTWPEACQLGGLPWEASAAVLELLGFLHRAGSGRPLMRVGRWFWHVTLAAPDLPVRDRFAAARQLSAWEVIPHEENVRPVEWHLAYAPWRSQDATNEYQQAVSGDEHYVRPVDPFARESFPEWTRPRMRAMPGDSREDFLDAQEDLLGLPQSAFIRTGLEEAIDAMDEAMARKERGEAGDIGDFIGEALTRTSKPTEGGKS